MLCRPRAVRNESFNPATEAGCSVAIWCYACGKYLKRDEEVLSLREKRKNVESFPTEETHYHPNSDGKCTLAMAGCTSTRVTQVKWQDVRVNTFTYYEKVLLLSVVLATTVCNMG